MNDNERAIISVTTLSHGLVHTYELVIPLLMTLWIAEFGLTAAGMGVLVTVGYGLFGLGALPAGVLTDWFGSRRLIVGCLIGMGLAFMLLALSPNVWVLGLALLLWGLAASAHHPAALTLLSKGVRQRGHAFGYHGMAGNAGVAVGPAITLVLLAVIDWRLISVLLAVPALLGGWYALRLTIDEDRFPHGQTGEGAAQPVKSWSGFYRQSLILFTSAFVVLMGIMLVSGTFYRGVLTFFPEVLSDLPYLAAFELMGWEVEPGHFLYVALLSVGVFGQLLGGKLSDKIRPELGLFGVFGGLTVLMLLFGPMAEAGLVTLLVICCLLGVVLFMAQPLYQATVANYTSPNRRGLAYAYTFTGAFGVGALGASVAGFVLDLYGAQGMFLALAGIVSLNIFVAGFLAFGNFERRPRTLDRADDEETLSESAMM